MFSENHSDIIEYNGITYYRYWPILVNGSIKIKFKFINSNSQFLQAIVLSLPANFEGNAIVDGKDYPVRKTAFPMMNFWEDTAPSEFDVIINNFIGELKVCNGSDPIGTKQFCKHLSEGSAMIAQKLGNTHYRFYCHDHEYEGNCDNLIFEMQIEKTGDG